MKEIRKRVQNRPPVTASQTLETKWKNYYLNTENIMKAVTTNPNQAALSPHTGYDKFYAMSPRVEAGEVSMWSCLPDELWLIILSYLDRDDLHSVMTTCRELNRLAHDKSLWRKLIIKKKQLSDDEVLKIGELRPVDLSIVQCTGTKLNGDLVTNHGLMTMFSSCGRTLKSLSIASCVMPPLSGEALLHSAAMHCNQVSTLDVSWCNLSDNDMLIVADNFPVLSTLLMNGNQSVTDQAVKYNCQRFSHQLKRLELQGCFKVTNESLEVISCCIQLIGLNVGHCHKLSSSALASSIKQLTELEYLNLKGLKQVRDSCITTIVKCCTKIEHLDISQCTGLSARTLTEISCALCNLRTIEMAMCKNSVDDASLSCLLANCKSIQSVDLSSTPITNQSLESLAANCATLQDLKVNFCSVTDSAVRQLLEHLSGKIGTIQLYGVKGINAQELAEFFPTVKVLS